MTLTERITAYLLILAPHKKERMAAKLLKEACERLKQDAQDWADTDTECRKQAKRVLDPKVVYGDQYCIPSVSDLCEWMADEIERLRNKKCVHELTDFTWSLEAGDADTPIGGASPWSDQLGDGF